MSMASSLAMGLPVSTGAGDGSGGSQQSSLASIIGSSDMQSALQSLFNLFEQKYTAIMQGTQGAMGGAVSAGPISSGLPVSGSGEAPTTLPGGSPLPVSTTGGGADVSPTPVATPLPVSITGGVGDIPPMPGDKNGPGIPPLPPNYVPKLPPALQGLGASSTALPAATTATETPPAPLPTYRGAVSVTGGSGDIAPMPGDKNGPGIPPLPPNYKPIVPPGLKGLL